MVQVHERMFERVRKGAVTDVVQEYGDAHRFGFLVADGYALGAQYFDGRLRQVQCSKSMVKPGMQGTRINIVGQPQLFYPPQSLEIRVIYEIKQDTMRHMDEAINRVVEYFIQAKAVFRCKNQ